MRSSRRRHYRARRAAAKGSFVHISTVQAVVPGGPGNTVATAIPRLPHRQPNGEWARAS